ncbi:MAG: NADH-quinone oxidoreductase subunit L [Fimbriimonadales bacterium]
MDYSLIWLVLFLPLVGSLIQALFGKRVVGSLGVANGRRVMGTLAVAAVAIPFLIGAALTFRLAGEAAEARAHVVTLYDWISLQNLRIPFEARIDTLSMTMVLIVTGVGSLIHLYATGYMAEEPDYPRFFTYLNLFVAAMLMLVLGNNLALMFIGWEGVGLCSYLLIGFWYKDVANAKAANKAFIVNRIGDVGFTLGMFLMATVLYLNADKLAINDPRWFSYDVILPNAVAVLKDNPGWATAIGLLLFVGACGKSAQFPLYFWLPDAMAGPTPVSALIHAATMVTSGVVLLNRMHVVFEMSPVASAVVACVGAFTALFAALIAFGQTDIKKVLAYSTVSQLGFMFIACGAGAYWAGMFHVTTHAFFKALLFLGSGAVIHAMAHNQDMRNYGNLRKYLPITFITMMVGYVAIAGVPLFAGFYSKEAILGGALGNELAVVEGRNLGAWAGWTGLFVAALTAMYMTRMTWLTFFGNEERWRAIPAHAHGHDDHAHEEHAAHAHHEDHAHGPDTHGFFMTDEEMAAVPHEHAHHHELDKDHTPHEVPKSMWVPLAVLAVLSALGGLVLEMNHTFHHWLYPEGKLAFVPETMVEGHPHNLPLLALSIAAASAGIIAGLLVYWKGLPKKEGWDESKWNPFRRWAGNQFGYDNAVVSMGVDGGREVALGLWKGVDSGVIDGTANGIAWFASKLGQMIGLLQTGYIRAYALMMLAGGVGILGYFIYAIQNRGGLK